MTKHQIEVITSVERRRRRAADCCTNTCTGCSGSCRDRSVCGSGGSAMVRGFTIFVHRFAVQALTNWYRAGEDVERELPVLSTFRGHANVRDTYWYLSAAPELMTMPRDCWISGGRFAHECLERSGRADRAVVHRSAHATSRRKLQHHRLLPGDLPAPVCICANTPWQVSVAADTAGFGRACIGAFLEDLETRRSASVRPPPHGHSVFLQVCVVRGAGP